MHFHSLAVAAFVTATSAHQNFHQLWVNGVTPGYQVGIRMPPSNNPVTNVSSNDITCNVNGNIVPSGVATVAANAGDSIKVAWDSSTHPGPITHMLFGPVSNASQATGVGSWTKIDELDYVNGQWANEIMEAQNMTHEFNLPAKLASGDYLVSLISSESTAPSKKLHYNTMWKRTTSPLLIADIIAIYSFVARCLLSMVRRLKVEPSSTLAVPNFVLLVRVAASAHLRYNYPEPTRPPTAIFTSQTSTMASMRLHIRLQEVLWRPALEG